MTRNSYRIRMKIGGAARKVVTLLAVIAALALAGGRMGLFSGTRPELLGVREGRFAPCKTTPNCVSSQADAARDPGHYVAPIQIAGKPGRAWAALESVVRALPGARVVSVRPDYLYAEFSSRVMGFVDDVEFLLDEKNGVIHARSASRLGVGDFGVNRRRVESVRSRLAAAMR